MERYTVFGYGRVGEVIVLVGGVENEVGEFGVLVRFWLIVFVWRG